MIWSFATLCNFDLLAYHGIFMAYLICFDLFWSVVVLLQAAGAVCVGRWMGSELPAMPALCRTLNPPCRHRPQLEARANLKQHDAARLAAQGLTRWTRNIYGIWLWYYYDYMIMIILYCIWLYCIWYYIMIHDSWWNFRVMPSASGWFYTDIPGVVFSCQYLICKILVARMLSATRWFGTMKTSPRHFMDQIEVAWDDLNWTLLPGKSQVPVQSPVRV